MGKLKSQFVPHSRLLSDGKQAAFLVPTTILAQQHFETMKERFAGFPVEVSLLNRFRTKKQQKETLTGMKAGTIDIVVGTHRLLIKRCCLSGSGPVDCR